jgi:hypothetical protein
MQVSKEYAQRQRDVLRRERRQAEGAVRPAWHADAEPAGFVAEAQSIGSWHSGEAEAGPHVQPGASGNVRQEKPRHGQSSARSRSQRCASSVAALRTCSADPLDNMLRRFVLSCWEAACPAEAQCDSSTYIWTVRLALCSEAELVHLTASTIQQADKLSGGPRSASKARRNHAGTRCKLSQGM